MRKWTRHNAKKVASALEKTSITKESMAFLTFPIFFFVVFPFFITKKGNAFVAFFHGWKPALKSWFFLRRHVILCCMARCMDAQFKWGIGSQIFDPRARNGTKLFQDSRPQNYSLITQSLVSGAEWKNPQNHILLPKNMPVRIQRKLGVKIGPRLVSLITGQLRDFFGVP